jgi:hypothetical protein
MTSLEFAKVMNYIANMIGKPIGATPKEADARMEGYWELLKDLRLDILQAAAKRVVLEHKWNTFPTVAEIRELATQTAAGTIAELPPAEAWRLASEAIAKIDPEIRGPYRMRGRDGVMREFPSQAEAVLDRLPPIVTRAIRAYGLHPMCFGQEPMGVVRGQFLRIYEQLAEQEKKSASLPAALVKEIQAKQAALPAPSVAGLIESIGKEV